MEESAAPRAWEHLVTVPPGFTQTQLCFHGSSWTAACESNDQSTHGTALALGALRLFLWHAMPQPVAYMVAWTDVSSTLGWGQRVLGNMVFVREAMYLLSVMLCAVVNPAFLAVDVVASVHATASTESAASLRRRCIETNVHRRIETDGKEADGAAKRPNHLEGFFSLAVYVLTPDMFVSGALCAKGGLDNTSAFMIFYLMSFLTSLAGVGALCIGIGSLPAALDVGYGATWLAVLFMAVMLIGLGLASRKAALKNWLFVTLRGFFWLFALSVPLGGSSLLFAY